MSAGKPSANRAVPVVVADLPGLDRAIDDYLAREVHSPRTTASYQRRWRTWTRYCTARGAEALPTAVSVLARFLTETAAGSRSLSDADGCCAAIAYMHRRAGLRSPTDDPLIRELRRGLRRRKAGVKQRKAHALDPADLRQLLHACGPSWPPHRCALRGAVQVMLDSGLPLRGVASAARSAVSVTAGGAVLLTLAGGPVVFRCAHAPAAARAECTACTLRELDRLLPADAPYLFALSSRPVGTSGAAREPCVQTQRARAVVRALVRDLAPAALLTFRDDRLTASADADPALARRALTLATAPSGIYRQMLRTAFLVGWHLGLRGDDICRMSIGDLDRVDRGYRLRFPQSKGDQGRRGVTLGLVPASDPALDPVRALDDWLPLRLAAARAAAHPPEEPLFPFLGVYHFRRARRALYDDFYGSLRAIAREAGVPAVAAHSLRRGFAVTALQQGASLEAIQHTLRHAKPETTQAYLDGDCHGEPADLFARLIAQPEQEKVREEHRGARGVAL